MSDRVVEYRARIGELEATIVSECDQKYLLVAEINDLKGRVEALEAALREIADGSFVTGTAYDARRIARAALNQQNPDR